MDKRRRYYTNSAIPAILLLVLVFALPLGAVFFRAFSSSKEGILDTLLDPYTWRLLRFTVWESFLSALVSVVLALPFALFFSRYTFPGRKAILTLSDSAFALPSILVILGFVIYYGNNGILNSFVETFFGKGKSLKILYSFKAIILAHVYLNFPIALSLITGAMVQAGRKEERVSQMLGASPLKTFFRVTLPKSKGTVLSAFVLIFLFCFPSFLIVMTLGGKVSYYTIEAEIFRRTYGEAKPNPGASASLAIFSFLCMGLLLFITGYGREERKVSRKGTHLEKARGRKLLEAFLLVILILLMMAPPLLSILYRSFFSKDGTFSLKAWTSITKGSRGAAMPLEAVINSILIATAASWVSMEAATRIALASVRNKSRLIPLLTTLPMAAGSVTMGLGYSFIASTLPLSNKATSYLLVFLAHTVMVLPFATRAIVPGANRIPRQIPMAAGLLGGSPKRAYLDTERPLLRSYRRKAFAFAFALSLGETNATLALGEGRITTLPILIYRMFGTYNYQGASALAVILLLMAGTVFAIGEAEGDRNGIS